MRTNSHPPFGPYGQSQWKVGTRLACATFALGAGAANDETANARVTLTIAKLLFITGRIQWGRQGALFTTGC
jgi:hypothetical protein